MARQDGLPLRTPGPAFPLARASGEIDDGPRLEDLASQPEVASSPGFVKNVFSLVVVGVVAVAGVWLFMGSKSEPNSQALTLTAEASGPAPRVGKPAPDIRLLDLDGKPVQLADFRGRAVWVTFWASWCPPCRAENPDIQASYEKYRDAGLVVLAVDIGEDSSTVKGYVERTGLTFPIALDLTTEVAASYRIAGIPTHFFVDAEGVIRDWKIGGMGKKTMDQKIQALLSRQPAPAGGR